MSDESTKKAMKMFRAAAQKVGKNLARMSNGERIEVYKEIDALDRRADKPEIAGDVVAREEAWGIISALRTAQEPAREAGRKVRSDENAKLQTQSIRDRQIAWNSLTQYEKDLALNRGKR